MIHTATLPAFIQSSLGANHPADTVWTYASDDPFAIKIKYPDGTTWDIGRDLVADAIITNKMVGEGDIKIQTDGDWLRMFIDTPDGTGVIRVIKYEVIDFIDESIKIVGPDDAETKIAQSELDDVLTMILSEAEEV